MVRLAGKIALLSLSCTLGLLFGCTVAPHRAYRDRQCQTIEVNDPRYDKECFGESDGGAQAGRCSIEHQPGYDLAFLEFDDQGNYFEPCELDRANFIVDQANEKAKAADPRNGGALVVVFVHGWRNDASEDNEHEGNLANFKTTLAELVDLEATCTREAKDSQQRAKCPAPRPVVGVYVAWRGDFLRAIRPLKSIDWMFDWATFWNREAAAQRIASRPIATQALLLLLENVKAENQNARVIAVGHSMGAQLLEEAISQGLVTRIIDEFYKHRDGAPIHIQPLADLVVFVNSAAQALEAQALVDTLAIREIRLDAQQGSAVPAVTGPLLLSLTATNDNATGWLFPKALFLSTWHQSFQDSSDPQRPTEKDLARHTPGHVSSLFSHKELHYENVPKPCLPKQRIDPDGAQQFLGIASDVGLCMDSSDDGSTIAFSVRSDDGYSLYRLVRDPAAKNRTPYWILQVPPSVIDGHSKIFEKPFRDFLRGLIVVTGAASRYIKRDLIPLEQLPKSVRPDVSTDHP